MIRSRCVDLMKILLLTSCVIASFWMGWHSVRGWEYPTPLVGKVKKDIVDFTGRPTQGQRVDVPSDHSTELARQAMARKRPWIILATTNSAFLDFTANWIESLRRCGIKDHVVIVAEDEEAHEYLLNVKDFELDVMLTDTGRSPAEILKFGSTDYLKFVNKRPNYILPFLKRGVDVLFSDVDTVWLKNPLPHLSDAYDLHLQRDLYGHPTKPEMICAGFVYYSATNATVEFIKRWMQMIQQRPEKSDQEMLNRLLRDRMVRRSLKIKKLDPVMFASGRYFFNEEWRKNNSDIAPVVVHNNWIKGHDVKIERFKNESMWYL